MKKKLFIVSAIFLFFAPSILSSSTAAQAEETESRVEELSEFHEIIYIVLE